MQKSQKIRIALGVFDDVVKLQIALDEFQAVGIALADIELIADGAVFSGPLAPAFKSDQGAPKRASPRVFIRGKKKEYAKEGTTQAQGPTFLATNGVSQFEDWISSELSDALNQHLAEGDCVLLAPVTSTDRERAICEILLKLSVGTIQLHDIQKPDRRLKSPERRTL